MHIFEAIMSFLRYRTVTYAIAVVWLLFGLLGKLLPISTTHHEIVARVFGIDRSGPITTTIGTGELFMAHR